MKRSRPAPLTTETVLILLCGFTLKAFPADSTKAARAEAVQLVGNEAGLRHCAALWAAHSAWLRRRASELRVKPAFKANGVPAYFAERLAFFQTQHDARRTKRQEARAAHV